MSRSGVLKLRRSSSGIRAKLLGIVLVATLPLVMLSLDSMRVYHRHDEERQLHAVAHAARGVVGLFDLAIVQGKTLAAALALNGAELLSLSRQSCNASLDRFRTIDSEIPWTIVIVGDDGWIACGTDYGGEPIYLGDRDHIRAARSALATVVGKEVVISRRSSLRVLPITSPIIATDQTATGVVAVGLPIDWLTDYALRANDLTSFPVQLFSPSLELLVERGTEGAKIGAKPDWLANIDPREEFQTITVDDLRVIVARSRPDGVRAVVTVDLDLADGMLQLAQWRNLAIAAFVLLGGLGLAWLFAKRAIATRLETLASYGERLGQGDLSATVSGFDTGDEFGRLALSLDKMAKRLGARIEDLADREAAARHAADHDPLTGAVNRRGFDNILATRLAWARSIGSTVALLLVDLDRFKSVNDIHGDQLGDHVLRTVVQRMQDMVRRDDVLARLGGDEFAILATSGDEPAAELLAERIVEALAKPVTLPNGVSVTVGASIGLAYFPHDAESPAELVHRADRALYRAKGRGRGRLELASSLETVTSMIAAQ